MIIFCTICTSFLLLVSYESIIMNIYTRNGRRPNLFCVDVTFYRMYLLPKNSPLNIIYFGSKCNYMKPHIGICCQCFIVLCGMFLVSIVSLALYYIYNELNIFLLLNIGIMICTLFVSAFFEEHVRKLVRKYRKEEEQMSKEEWLAIKKEIEEEWPGFWDEQK